MQAAAAGGAAQRIHLVLCLAENAISADALRNDDIITLFRRVIRSDQIRSNRILSDRPIESDPTG